MSEVINKPKIITKESPVKVPPLRQLSDFPESLAPGHRLCAGCGASIIIRQMFMAA